MINLYWYLAACIVCCVINLLCFRYIFKDCGGVTVLGVIAIIFIGMLPFLQFVFSAAAILHSCIVKCSEVTFLSKRVL